MNDIGELVKRLSEKGFSDFENGGKTYTVSLRILPSEDRYTDSPILALDLFETDGEVKHIGYLDARLGKSEAILDTQKCRHLERLPFYYAGQDMRSEDRRGLFINNPNRSQHLGEILLKILSSYLIGKDIDKMRLYAGDNVPYYHKLCGPAQAIVEEYDYYKIRVVVISAKKFLLSNQETTDSKSSLSQLSQK